MINKINPIAKTLADPKYQSKTIPKKNRKKLEKAIDETNRKDLSNGEDNGILV